MSETKKKKPAAAKPKKAAAKPKKKPAPEEEEELLEEGGLEEAEVVIDDDDEDVASLETIRKTFLKKGKEMGYINTGDVMDATSHLDLSEQDFEELIAFFSKNGIEIEAEDDEGTGGEHENQHVVLRRDELVSEE